MSNTYNKDIKNEFLSMYPSASQGIYGRILTKSYNSEKSLQKDLFDFSKEEIEEILYDLNPLTHAISHSNGRIITSYISWAIDKGYKKTHINPLKTVDVVWFEKFVDSTKKLYFSKTEIEYIVDFCENYQDAAIIQGQFERISGKEAIELRNLQKGDIDEKNNTLTVTNEHGVRKTLDVSEKCIEIMDKAARETTYTKKNGLMIPTDNVRDFTDLVDNNYVIRSSITKTESFNESVNITVVYRRISMISETLGIPYFTMKNIFRSGIIYWGKLLLDKYGKLEKEQYLEIAERFSINNWYSIKEYCNVEMIEKLYQ